MTAGGPKYKAAASNASNTNTTSNNVNDTTLSKSIPIVELRIQHVSYQPITSKITKQTKTSNPRTEVLKDITTKIAPYQLTGWMGPSGSGKSSLASVVAGLVSKHDVHGSIQVNGEEGRLPKRMVGVVWQDDLLMSNLTVEETIYFAARLKTPNVITDKQVKVLVEETMNELSLTHVRNHLIGSSVANIPGISGGERKRTAVAAELVVRPSLLLLDEPTSGLDATTAHALMSTLKDLTALGHAVAVVIHQPRADIFKLLDHLLLLSKGRVLYDGAAASIRNYLESCPDVNPLEPETGCADWIMDTITLDEAKLERASLANRWNAYQPIVNAQTSVNEPTYQMSTLHELWHTPRKFETSFSKQLQLLTRRILKQRRGEKLTSVSILLTLSYLIFTSIFWWRMPFTTAWIFERTSLIFFLLIAQGNSIVYSSMTVFQAERALLRRERAKKMYGILPYFLAKTVSDMTANILLPLCYGMITYFTAGLRPDLGSFTKFTFSFYLTLNCAQSMGLFLSILISNIQIALILAPPITLFFFIMGGFYIPLSNMHVGIKWASYLSFARYGYSSLLLNEFTNRDIPCADGNVTTRIISSTECPVPGDTIYDNIGIEGIYANYWFNVAAVAMLHFSFLTGAYILLRRSK